MSVVDVLVTVGPVTSSLETFPVWGPVLALVTVLLFIRAARMTWGTDAEDTNGGTVPAVPVVQDTGEDTLVLRRATCGDEAPRSRTGGA